MGRVCVGMSRRYGTFFRVLLCLGMIHAAGCSVAAPVRSETPSSPSAGARPAAAPAGLLGPLAVFQSGGPVYAQAVSPTGRYLALGGVKKIVLWDLVRKEVFRTYVAPRDVVSLAFSPDGTLLAAGSYQEIDLWHVAGGRRLSTLSGHQGYVTSLVFCPDGRRIASGSSGEENAIHLWDLEGMKLLGRLTYATRHAEMIRALAFSPDGRRIASVGLDRTVRVWNLEAGESGSRRDPISADTALTPQTIAFGPDRKTLALGSAEGPILLYDSTTGRMIKKLEGHVGAVLAVAFSPDGETLLSSGSDRTLRRWEVNSGRLIRTQQFRDEARSVALTHDGAYMAVAGPSAHAVFALTKEKGIPPVVAILTPLHEDSVERPVVHLTAKVVDDKGVAEVAIHVNDALWDGGEEPGVRGLTLKGRRSDREIVLDERIPLRAGRNRITVTAYDLEGLIRSESVDVTFTEEKGEVWAAVIGINRYQHVSGLRYADVDAKRIYDYLVLENQIPKDHVTLLLNEEATLQRVRDLLGVELKEKARRRDTVLIYYAGHGAPEADRSSLDGDKLEKYLLPYDANPSRLYSTALPMAEVSKIFSRLSAERVVMLQDTCFSGSSGGEGRTIQTDLFRAPISDGFLTRLTQGKGRVIITASEPDEVSLERDDLGHGVFTYYLLEAFRKGDVDGDGLITTNELFRYVSEKVPAATGQKQHPVKKGVESTEIVLGKVRTKE